MLSSINKRFFRLAVGPNIGRETDTDISARCPVCGDSAKSKNKKRLHLYHNSGVELVHCFNGDCPVQNRTMYTFLRDFFPAYFAQYKRENFDGKLQNLASGEQDVFSGISVSKKETAILTQDLSPHMLDLAKSPEGMAYIRSRGLGYDPDRFGKWFYGTKDLKIGGTLYKVTDSVIIPLYYNGEMYGFYSRNTKFKSFYTYMNDANVGYKVWNWFSADPTKELYIFEGIFDAISSGLENVVALMGAKIPSERLMEAKKPVFVLDNDRTGLINTIEYAKQGHMVYIQPEGYPQKDMNSLMVETGECPAELIKRNLYTGISAEVRIKSKL